MADYVLCFDDEASFIAGCQMIPGAWYDGNPAFDIPAGPCTSGVGWTIIVVGTRYQPTGNIETDPDGNEVPEYAPMPGYWVRLRWLRDDPVPVAPDIVTVYPEQQLLEDGTPDPDYTQPLVGMIA